MRYIFATIFFTVALVAAGELPHSVKDPTISENFEYLLQQNKKFERKFSIPSDKELYVVGNATFTGVVSASSFNVVASAYMVNGSTVIDGDGNINAADMLVTGNLVVDGSITGTNVSTGINPGHMHNYALEVDVNGDLMPTISTFTDVYFELDANGDLQPKL